MTRNIFGWNYPAGAENDPNAPYNQGFDPCEDIPSEVFDQFEKCTGPIDAFELWNEMYDNQRKMLQDNYKDELGRLRADDFSKDIDTYNSVYHSDPPEPYLDEMYD